MRLYNGALQSIVYLRSKITTRRPPVCLQMQHVISYYALRLVLPHRVTCHICTEAHRHVQSRRGELCDSRFRGELRRCDHLDDKRGAARECLIVRCKCRRRHSVNLVGTDRLRTHPVLARCTCPSRFSEPDVKCIDRHPAQVPLLFDMVPI
jgi:hypothetical protein